MSLGSTSALARQRWAAHQRSGAPVLYREYPLPHAIDPRFLAELRPWLAEALKPS